MGERQPMRFRLATLDWTRTCLIGVVNVTPDSFSDGGSFLDPARALAQGQALLRAGATWVDVGGESTRPGAAPVSAAEERARVLPVVAALATQVTVSVDTSKAEVADAALEAGAEVVNDVSGGLFDPELLRVVARRGATVILGHLRGTPADMSSRAVYADVVAEVLQELGERLAQARAAGVERGKIWIDPGLGFAKTTEHNLSLLARLGELRALGAPIVVGASRKRFLGELTGRPPGERELGTAAANVAAVLAGADALRVHDVATQRDPVRVADAIRRAGEVRA